VRELVSPKQVARAIGVSESSLKRWCDQGVLRSIRTEGGHRRIRVTEVLKYLRERGQRPIEPEILGLPPVTTGAGSRSIGKAREELIHALIRGDETLVRQLGFDLYLSRHRMATLCDEVLAPAFHDIGRQWGCGEVAIYQERRSCEITLRFVQELRSMLAEPEATGPRAIGGTLVGDYYTLPTALVELVLLECGWNATSLGTSLPVTTLMQAATDLKPKLVWLSLSSHRDESLVAAELEQLRSHLEPLNCRMIVGGQRCPSTPLPGIQELRTMTELQLLAESLHPRPMGSN